MYDWAKEAFFLQIFGDPGQHFLTCAVQSDKKSDCLLAIDFIALLISDITLAGLAALSQFGNFVFSLLTVLPL